MPEEEDEKPRILCFICENDAYPALDMSAMKRHRLQPVGEVHSRALPGLGEHRLDRATRCRPASTACMLIGCKFGDDYQCHFVRGSELANRRLENVKETLQRLQLESERIALTQLSINEGHKLPGLFNAFAARIREIGPNPYGVLGSYEL